MSDMKQPDLARREFLSKTTKAAAGVSLASGVMLYSVAQAKPADQPASSDVRWGMLVDTNKCTNGCDACVTACEQFNGWGSANPSEKNSAPEQKAQWIRKVELHNKETGHTHSLPMMCQHCETPPCADVCPTGASFKRADGIVLLDKHICIGCRYCMMACPYKARSFIHETIEDQRMHAPRGKGTVESCNLCVSRVDNGEQPACVEACNADGHKAILFGDLKDPNSEISQAVKKYSTTQVRADLGLNPGVRYKGI
jgi:molybdopterin-containing oxidoreductase family iron-sulfur binding subunit